MCSSDPADTLWAIMITCISSRGPRLPALLPPTMTQRVDVLSLDGFASHASIVNYGTSKLACHLRSPGWKEKRSWQTPYKKNKRYKNEGEKKEERDRNFSHHRPQRNENALNQSWPERRLDEGLWMGGRWAGWAVQRRSWFLGVWSRHLTNWAAAKGLLVVLEG